MALIELVLRAPAELVESVCDALMEELDAVSVSVEDADADTESEQALFGEPGLPAPAAGWNRSTLRVAFSDEEAATQAATLLLAQDWTTGLRVDAIQAVPEADWVRLTQSQFEPVSITPSFWVVPTWHEPPAQARQVIRLDPGMAFGTGSHPTTRLCLEWLEGDAQPAGKSVLDYGCGSGILAIAALRLGTRAAYAHDIDPQALIASRDNAALNGVADALHCVASADELSTLVANRGGAKIVLANILSGPLCELAPRLTALLSNDGILVLAGLLDEQADEVIRAYSALVPLSRWRTLDGWTCLVGQRRG